MCFTLENSSFGLNFEILLTIRGKWKLLSAYKITAALYLTIITEQMLAKY